MIFNLLPTASAVGLVGNARRILYLSLRLEKWTNKLSLNQTDTYQVIWSMKVNKTDDLSFCYANGCVDDQASMSSKYQ